MNKKYKNNLEEGNRQIKYGAAISYILIIFNTVAGLLYTPWMVNQIGQSDYGLYTLAMSVINLFLMDFGLSQAVSRFVSKYNSEGKQDKVNNFLGIAYKMYLLIDLFIMIVFIFIFLNIDNIYQGLTIDELSKFKVVFSVAGIFSVIQFPFISFNGILNAYEKFIELKICDLINRVLSISLIVIALLNGYGLYALVAANAASGILTIVMKYIVIKRKTPVKSNLKYVNHEMTKEVTSFSTWSAVISIAQRLIFNITPTIIGIVSKSANIGIFGIAMSLEGYVFTLANALNGLFLPRITRLVTKENWEKNLLDLMIKIGRIQLYIIGLIFIGFMTLGNQFVYLWMGEGFTSSFYSAVLLILPSIIYLPQQIGNTAIIALNKVKLQAKVYVVMGIINVILSFVFSYYWGSIGASLSICIAYFIRSLGLNKIFYRELNIDIKVFYKKTYGKNILCFLIVLIMSYVYNIILPPITWTSLFIKGTLIVLTYIIIVWNFSMNEFEKNLLKKIVRKF